MATNWTIRTKPNTTFTRNRETIGDFRITEGGDFRIIESGLFMIVLGILSWITRTKP